MLLEIVSFKKKPFVGNLGVVIVKYELIFIKCDLVYHTGNKKAWIRMPEFWKTPKEKTRFVYWDTKEISDDFQKVVLNKLFAKYDLDLAKIQKMHDDAIKRKTKNKKTL